MLVHKEHAMAPTPTSAANTAVYKYMPSKHVVAFQRAAAKFKVWILVRRGNPQSLQWIGKDGYVPKPLDCKAKTANNPNSDCVGLVADPSPEYNAFVPGQKLQDALEIWQKFKKQLYIFDKENPQQNHEADRAGKHYTLQLDKTKKHYGCVMYKPVFRAKAEFLHADYDLYAIVPEANPKANIFVQEKGFGGADHSRSQFLYDVQYFFKAAGIREGEDFCSPMIRHGEQETFKTDWDDKLDVFWPDGQTISELISAEAIREFYQKTLGGRMQMETGAKTSPVSGNWVTKSRQG
jgi:hypothetical protein